MILKTILPMYPTVSINEFIELVSSWGIKSGNLACKIHLPEKKGSVCQVYRLGKTIVSVLYEEESQVSAVQIRKSKVHGPYCCWEFVYVKPKSRLFINFEDNLHCLSMGYGFTKPFSTPGIIRTAIARRFCDTPTGCLPITSHPLVIDEENKGVISSYINRLLTPVNGESAADLKPLIYVPLNGSSRERLAASDLAFRLKGFAHVVFPASQGIHRYIKKQVRDIRLRAGQITIIYPQTLLGKTLPNVQYYPLHMSKTYMDRFFLQIIDFAGTFPVPDTYSFEQIKEALLIRKIRELNEAYKKELRSRETAEKEIDRMHDEGIHLRDEITAKAMSEAEEIIESYELDIEDLMNKNYEMEMQIQGLETENSRLRSHLPYPDRIPALYFGKEKEFYVGEIPDLLMSVLEDSLASIPEKSRKRDIVTDVLSANGYQHIGHIRNEKVRHLLKSYNGMTRKIRGGLEDLGFRIEETSGHCKVTYFGDRRYLAVLGSTPSDVRSGKNNAALITKIAY